ncbi:MFS general substrate transporter [Glonium stellatum]|uniref:MFS general substrate transporter n=1 Tax=Glonium stellatum TaxID=574774 RepID=A0A8E2JPG6_9PEZI|nr:MFS general substrate transporter [Glonium stellatum]
MAYQTHTRGTSDTIAVNFQAVPGTEILFDDSTSKDEVSRYIHGLQHVKHGDSRIILVPQPSLTNPNDPLRWPSSKKWMTLLNGMWYAFDGAVTGPIMAAGMVQLSEAFGQPFQKLTYANGATLICQGVATTIWMPFAVQYGRRPVYLLSNFLMGIACIRLGIASTKSYTPFLIGRAFLGVFEAPIESIVPSTITDIFFLHERGEKVSLYGLSVLGGNELGPMLSAFIIQSLGMSWAFYIFAIVIGVNLIAMFLLMPETKFTSPQ